MDGDARRERIARAGIVDYDTFDNHCVSGVQWGAVGTACRVAHTYRVTLSLDAPVRVATDSYPGKTYQGRVSFISSEAEFTPKQIQTAEERVKLVYRIKVDLPNPNRELKLNMPADAEILLADAAAK